MPVVQIEQFVESVREPGTPNLSPARIAEALGLQHQELASVARVHRNTLRLHPESAQVQASMRDIVRVVSALAAIQPDIARAMFMLKNTPVPAFGHRQLLAVIADGRADDVVTYVRSISAGYVG